MVQTGSGGRLAVVQTGSGVFNYTDPGYYFQFTLVDQSVPVHHHYSKSIL